MLGQQNIKCICTVSVFKRIFSRRVVIFILNSYKCVQILRELLYSYVLKGTSINTAYHDLHFEVFGRLNSIKSTSAEYRLKGLRY